MMPAITRGANAFHSGVAAFATGWMPDSGGVPLDGAACVTLPRVVLETPIFILFKRSTDRSRRSISDVDPTSPIVKVATGRGLFYELAWKEVAVLCEPPHVAIHLPLQLGGRLRGDISRVALQARNDYGVAYAV